MADSYGEPSNPLRQLTAGAGGTMTALVFLTLALALLPVALALFCILVFDVAMVGRSGESLLGILLLTMATLAFMTAFAYLRARILMQFATALDIRLGHAAIEARSRFTAADGGLAEDMLISHMLDGLRRAISGRGASALLDLGTIIPLLIVTAILSGWMALTLFIAFIVVGALLLRAWRRARVGTDALLSAVGSRHVTTETHRRHAELIRALGMRPDIVLSRRRVARRVALLDQAFGRQETTGTIIGQGLVDAAFVILIVVGAWLAIDDKASAGVVIAAAVIGTRAMAPLVTLNGHLQELADGLQAWRCLNRLITLAPAEIHKLSLPAPTASVVVEQIAVAPPDTRTVVLRDVSFDISAGAVLGVIGMTGSGKSSLLRAMAGIWPVLTGKIRIDDAALDQWPDDQITRHIGYLPQTIDLFSGTIAENIARFAPDATSEAVVAAAIAAHAHDMIVRLPQGYATQVGEEGVRLSVAQRQRVALARALYGDPFLLLLDEPATHLDGRGQQALGSAIVAAKARGAVIIMVGNAAATVDIADYIMVLRDGGMQDFGPKQDVRQRLLEGRKPVPAAPGETTPHGGQE